jgi:hypothetical protein
MAGEQLSMCSMVISISSLGTVSLIPFSFVRIWMDYVFGYLPVRVVSKTSH